MERSDAFDGSLVSTGVAGLDDILRGGYPPCRLYLVEGHPGSGKTTLAMQFLMDGVRRGESALYVTLSETKRELLAVARSHGWSLDGIHIHEMEVSEAGLSPDSQLTMFHPSELELAETTKAVLLEVERIKPKRVVFDSLSEMRLLAQNALRYRRQILGLKQFFVGRESTVLLLDDRTTAAEDLQLQSIVHGVIRLGQNNHAICGASPAVDGAEDARRRVPRRISRLRDPPRRAWTCSPGWSPLNIRMTCRMKKSPPAIQNSIACWAAG